MLVVAADDGVMPQTAEHLTILSLLGVRHGAAVITKTDRVDAATVSQRRAEVQALLANSSLAGCPVFEVSALRGDGIDMLRAHLLQAAQAMREHHGTNAAFRMALDRVFTLDGIGTVVAGSVAAGAVRVGDILCLANDASHGWRVRSLQSHGREVQAAQAGQRCAIALAGLDRQTVQRGQTLCDPSIAQHSLRLDVWLEVAASEDKPLRSGTQVHLHLGTQEVMASVAVLGAGQIAPGQAALAQLVAREAVHAWWGDRFVLRDASAARTVAGGSVLDAQAPARYRQTPQRLAYLDTQREPRALDRLQAALSQAPFGIDRPAWLRNAGLTDTALDTGQLQQAVHGADWIIGEAALQANASKIFDELRLFHQKYPEDIGPDVKRARRLALPRMPEPLWLALVDQLVASEQLARRAGFVHLPEHGVQLREAERVVAQRALPLLLQGRFDPPWVRDIAGSTGIAEVQVRNVLGRLAKGGEVFQIVKDLFYHPKVVQELADLARCIEQRDGEVLAASFRDATGLGRKRAIQILEFFDRIGFLRRVGDTHLLRPGTPLFPAGEKA